MSSSTEGRLKARDFSASRKGIGAPKNFALRGFTLFEFIVVASIVVIVIVVAMINSPYFLTRVRVMKVKEEHSHLKRAFGNYQIDHNSYPGTSQGFTPLMQHKQGYLSNAPLDPFNKQPQGATYQYLKNPGGGYSYALISVGPDGVPDYLGAPAIAAPTPPPSRYLSEAPVTLFEASSASLAPQPTNFTPAGFDRNTFDSYITLISYDPTNGTKSRGDIITLTD